MLAGSFQGDINYLFRAVADQLEEDEENHSAYRNLAVEFLNNNKEYVRKFFAQDKGDNFDDYISRMEKNGTWGGHLELSALSESLNLTIQVYIKDQESITIEGSTKGGARVVRLAYHRAQEHYDSVRRLDGKHEEWPDLVFTKQGLLDRRCTRNRGALTLEQLTKRNKKRKAENDLYVETCDASAGSSCRPS